MDNRVIELAEKIYSRVVSDKTTSGINYDLLKCAAEASIMAAQVFYAVKRDKMLGVKEGER